MHPRTLGRAGSPKEPDLRLRAHEVAKAAGISKNTLLRWLKAGKVPEVARDRNGWRIFTQDDVARVRAFADRTTPPGEFHAMAPGKEEAA